MKSISSSECFRDETDIERIKEEKSKVSLLPFFKYEKYLRDGTILQFLFRSSTLFYLIYLKKYVYYSKDGGDDQFLVYLYLSTCIRYFFLISSILKMALFQYFYPISIFLPLLLSLSIFNDIVERHR